MMEFEISLSDLRFFSYHGVMAHEKEFGNEFKVTLTVSINIDERDIEKDNLSSTVSYADLYEVIKEEMASPVNLLENLCYKIVKKVKDKFPEIKGGKCMIEKMHPPIKGILGKAAVGLNF